MSKLALRVHHNGSLKLVEVDRGTSTVRRLEEVVARALGAPAVELHYTSTRGITQGIYQDFHLVDALRDVEFSGKHFFELTAVAPGGARPHVAEPARVASPPSHVTPVPVAQSPVRVPSQEYSRPAEPVRAAAPVSPAPAQVDAKFCSTCGIPAVGRFCSGCGSPLAGSASPVPSPSSSFNSPPAVAASHAPVYSSPHTPAELSPAETTAPFICAGCSLPLGLDAVGALDKNWHPNCFVCQTCRTPLLNKGFKRHEGRPYCSACYESEAAIKCAKCFRPIQGSYLDAGGKPVHPECFTCVGCHGKIQGAFANTPKGVLCRECAIVYTGRA